MPTINFSLKDLNNLVGKNLKIEEVEDLVEFGKGELEEYDKKTDEAKVNFDDTNLPYLWSVEGAARLIKGVLGKNKGIPKIKIHDSSYELIVDKSVKKVRPYICSFIAKGHKIDDYLIKQIIQLQEKLCESFGRKRLKAAIGIYSYDKITFPIKYKAVDPESIEFKPLEWKRPMTQQEILESHPAGQKYAWILESAKKYPILIDSKNEVLSFPPIINSNTTGKIEIGEENLFFEVTGTDMETINIATNIFAQALHDRGFKIYSIKIKYDNKTIKTPLIKHEKIKVKKERIKELTGLDLKETEIKKLLQKAQFEYDKGNVLIPHYRADIIHDIDVIEEVAIMYDFNKIPTLPLTSYTIGESTKLMEFIDIIRNLIVGFGYQETMSPILSSKEIIFEKMNVEEFSVIEIEEFMTESYSVVRNWLLPTLMEILSKNKHVEYPQKIFEQGLVTVKKKENIIDYERIAVASAHQNSDYTEIKQILDYVLRMLNVEYDMRETKHDSFIEGRVARVSVKGKDIAYIGELHPQVLKNFDLDMPVAAFELNISELYDLINK
ncbi:phenylalanine--tRNA ligase subunit beta [Nanoarchaeota archaeon]